MGETSAHPGRLPSWFKAGFDQKDTEWSIKRAELTETTGSHLSSTLEAGPPKPLLLVKTVRKEEKLHPKEASPTVKRVIRSKALARLNPTFLVKRDKTVLKPPFSSRMSLF